MHRYNFTNVGITQTVAFLKGKSKDAPGWAKRFKEDLKAKGKKVFYKELEVIPQEGIDDYLRTKMFEKNGKLPFGRDAAFHKLKQTTVGIPRRKLMAFIKAQPIFEHTKAAVPQAKQKGGPKLKTYTIESDLVFIRKNDLVRSNPRFDKTIKNQETYIVSTV